MIVVHHWTCPISRLMRSSMPTLIPIGTGAREDLSSWKILGF